MGKLIKSDENRRGNITLYERQALESASSEPDWSGEEAHPDPESILETARLETERLAQEAYEEGFRKGRADGEDEFRKEVGASAEALAAVSESIRAAHGAFLESLEPQVLSLVQAIVQRVLYRDMRADPDLVLRTVRHALENLTDRARLLVRLNPADLEVVRNHKLTFLEEFDGVRQMELMGDDTITSGGCIVESELMQVDAQLDERLERVFEAMLE
jgi:flagellar assembly protein FliH